GLLIRGGMTGAHVRIAAGQPLLKTHARLFHGGIPALAISGGRLGHSNGARSFIRDVIELGADAVAKLVYAFTKVQSLFERGFDLIEDLVGDVLEFIFAAAME